MAHNLFTLVLCMFTLATCITALPQVNGQILQKRNATEPQYDSYATFWSHKNKQGDCEHMVGSVGYAENNPGCFYNEGRYLSFHCAPTSGNCLNDDCVRLEHYSEPHCKGKVQRAKWNAIAPPGCFDLKHHFPHENYDHKQWYRFNVPSKCQNP